MRCCGWSERCEMGSGRSLTMKDMKDVKGSGRRSAFALRGYGVTGGVR
jgi:hypothetical protein